MGKTKTKFKLTNGMKTGIKFLLVFSLLYYLSKRGFLSIQETQRALFQWSYTVPAFLALTVTALLGFIRWHLLLKAQDIQLNWTRTFQLTFIGNFFNISLPGAVSGDLIKAIYVGKEVEGERARAFSSILFDRVAGVSSLVFVAMTGVLLSLAQPWSGELLRPLQLFLVLSGVSVILFYAYLFLVKESKDPLLVILKRLENRAKIIGSVLRIYEGIRAYRSKKKTVAQVLVISTVIHVLVIFSYFLFTQAFGVSTIHPLQLLIIVPLGLLVTAVPIMPAGIGTGHAAFTYLYLLLGFDRGADVFNLFILFQLMNGGFGGILYLRFKSRPNGGALPPVLTRTGLNT